MATKFSRSRSVHRWLIDAAHWDSRRRDRRTRVRKVRPKVARWQRKGSAGAAAISLTMMQTDWSFIVVQVSCSRLAFNRGMRLHSSFNFGWDLCRAARRQRCWKPAMADGGASTTSQTGGPKLNFKKPPGKAGLGRTLPNPALVLSLGQTQADGKTAAQQQRLLPKRPGAAVRDSPVVSPTQLPVSLNPSVLEFRRFFQELDILIEL